MYTSLFIHDRRNRRDVSSFMQNPTTIDLSTRGRHALSLSLSFSRESVTRDRIHGISTGYSFSFCDRNPMEITAVLFPSIQVSSFFPPFISFTFACSYSCSRLSPPTSSIKREPFNDCACCGVVGFSRSLGEFHEIMSLLVISAAKSFSRF